MDPLTCITNFIFYETSVKRSDAILIPGGARRELMERAADLYHHGLASVIVPSGGPNPLIPEYASEWEFLADIGMRLGVPATAILREDRASNTFENARFSLQVLTAAGIHVTSAIIVCKTYHAMRAYLTYASVFPPEVEFCVSPVVDDRDIRRQNWFLDPVKSAIVLGEVEKIGKYFPSQVPVLAARREVQQASAHHVRAAVLVVRGGRVAVIRRDHATGNTYYLFPGGQVEPGESLEQAAVREAREELGLVVRLGKLAAIVQHGGSEQYYYLAEPVGGRFGTGQGPEMSSPANCQEGSYTPQWMPLSDLPANDVRPRELALALAAGLRDVELPLRIRD